MAEIASPTGPRVDASSLGAKNDDGAFSAHQDLANGKCEADDHQNGITKNEDDPAPKTNGHVYHDMNGHGPTEQRPAKRQRTRDTTPPSTAKKVKPESPPWRRVDADGPTSFQQDGRRRSGRVNTIPLELQPPGKKRLTRQSLGGKQASSGKQQPLPNNVASKAAKGKVAPRNGPPSRSTHARSASASVSKSAFRQPKSEPRTSARSRRRTPSPQPIRHSTRPMRHSRLHDALGATSGRDSRHAAPSSPHRSPRIKLRVGRSGEIPLVHPGQIRKQPKIGTSFGDFWNRAGDIPVEQGGLLASEDGPVYTDEQAQKDARILLRIDHELEPGGLLSHPRCSIFVPEAVDEPPRQWARQDHIVKAASNFRRLMVAEQQRHRLTAKRIAEACRDEWLRRQPKSVEQIAAEAREKWMLRYRLVVRSLIGTWENVRLEVNRRRLEEWEAEEQRRVKAALNEAVSLSEQKLQARRAGMESEMPSDEDGFDDLSDDMDSLGDSDMASDANDDGDGDGDDEDSDNMSSSGDEEDGDEKATADEDLTQDQLRAKYASIPEVAVIPGDVGFEFGEPKSEEGSGRGDGGADDSDESIDMDDDLGSSMSEEDADEEDHESESEDESESEAGGLLGLLFGKSELKQMQEDATTTPADDAEMVDGPENGLSGDKGAPTREGSDEAATQDALSHDTTTLPKKALNGQPSVPNPVQKEAVTLGGLPGTAGETLESPTFNDTTMVDAQGMAVEVAQRPITPIDKLSPETEALTNPPSVEQSHTLCTSETKPSELDNPSGDGIVTRVVKSSSPAQSNHKTEIPFLLRGTLREYQHDGLDWLAGLYANNTNGILADEMGLGKTIQTIALLAHLACVHGVWGPHLVVVPTSVMLNWEMEFKKWCPGFKILAYYGSQDERKRKRQGWNNDDVWNVCITSYQLVLQDQQVFKRRRWHYLILDEAHNIKNFKSQRWQTLLGFNTHSRLLLTGTPLQNNLTELWSLLFFLMPAENGVGGFADLQEFHDWFHKPESQILENGREQMDDEARAIISKLHKVLRPYLLRRLKADVEKQMPAKYEHVEFCRLSKRQRELYDGFLARADTKNTLASGNYLSIINCLMQLRKVCNHPDLFVDRPIMTSFRMHHSVAADYDFTEQAVRKSLLAVKPLSTVDLGFLNLVPTKHEHLSSAHADRIAQLSSHRILMDLREAQRTRAQQAYSILDPATVESNIGYLENVSRWGRFEELQHCVYLNALRRQQRPIYGKNLVDLVKVGVESRPHKPRPKLPRKIMSWFEDESLLLGALTPSLEQRADSFKTTIEKFSCATPPVVTRNLETFLLGRKGVEAFTDEDLKLSAPVRWAPFLPKEPPPDPWHEARMRLTIQFPDKRLLQFDCGKLQILEKLLRKLQSGGHRALIFTQMTKVLDILELFLNIHGHKYLRLDGATKVEQRQILTDRFNHDPRILCFILSTRSGGLGINLTGADTVIFYDQDWNPAMDKQCQDRCHRIGQTRDVHIYRLVSEHTIEANILRKASQKQMLDDVVIQEGEFTTDYFNKVSVRDVLSENIDFTSEGVSAADAALDRVLGGPNSSTDQRTVGRVLEQAEDKEDVTAARIAEQEIQADDADFTEKPSNNASGASSARHGTPAGKSVLDGGLDVIPDGFIEEDEYNAWGDKMHTVDDFMLARMFEMLKFTKLELPKDKKKGKKKGKDTRKR